MTEQKEKFKAFIAELGNNDSYFVHVFLPCQNDEHYLLEVQIADDPNDNEVVVYKEYEGE